MVGKRVSQMPSVHVTIYEPDEYDWSTPNLNRIPTTVWVRGAVRPRNAPVSVTAFFGVTPITQPATLIDGGRRWETQFTGLPLDTPGTIYAEVNYGGFSHSDPITARTVAAHARIVGKKPPKQES